MNESDLQQENKALKEKLENVLKCFDEIKDYIRNPAVVNQVIPDVVNQNRSNEDVYHELLRRICWESCPNLMQNNNNVPNVPTQYPHLLNALNQRVIPPPAFPSNPRPIQSTTVVIPPVVVHRPPAAPRFTNIAAPPVNTFRNRVPGANNLVPMRYQRSAVDFFNGGRIHSRSNSSTNVGQPRINAPAEPVQPVHGFGNQQLKSSNPRKRPSSENNNNKDKPTGQRTTLFSIPGWETDMAPKNQSSAAVSPIIDILEENFDPIPDISIPQSTTPSLLNVDKRTEEEGEIDPSPQITETLIRTRLFLESQIQQDQSEVSKEKEREITTTSVVEKTGQLQIVSPPETLNEDSDVVFVEEITGEQSRRQREKSIMVLKIKKPRILIPKDEIDHDSGCDVSSGSNTSIESSSPTFDNDLQRSEFYENVIGNIYSDESRSSSNKKTTINKKSTTRRSRKCARSSDDYKYFTTVGTKEEVVKMAEEAKLIWHYTTHDCTVYFRCRYHQQCRLRWKVSITRENRLRIDRRNDRHQCS
uniref:Uncharacterized protein n=1 Tax=Panagrolaimus sp. JU765 TaxID=591449 RepID=A0AC34RCZ4_9BILA